MFRTKEETQTNNNERGAIDLASIMVGIIVIGVIGGVVAATVFAVIPWSQDKAAKAQLEQVTSAQSIYYAGSLEGKYASYEQLVKPGTTSQAFGELPSLVTASTIEMPTLNGVQQPLSIVLNVEENCYVSVIQSETGKYFSVTNQATSPVEFERGTTPGCVDAPTLEEKVEEAVTPPVVAEPEPEVTEPPVVTPEPEPPVVESPKQISTWDTSTTKTVTLPITGVTSGTTVNWGDGTIEPLTDNASHTYSGSGNQTVTVEGSFSNWSMRNAAYPSGPQLRTITQWDDEVGTTDLSFGFSKASGVTQITEIPSTTTALNSAFQDNTTFNGDISNWDVSNVTTFSWMFYNAAAFNQPLNTWNMSSAQNISYMFASASTFNQPLSSWDTSNVTDMSSTFSRATAFNGDISTWDTSNVTNMATMFSAASAFNKPVPFNTSNVTNMVGTFNAAASFNQPINWDTSRITSGLNMFNGATSFNQPLNLNFNSATSTLSMFQNTTSLNSPVTLSTPNVTTMQSMFQGANKFNSALTLDTRNVTSMNSMFYNATVFNQNLSGWNVAKVTNRTPFSTGSSLSTPNLPKWVA